MRNGATTRDTLSATLRGVFFLTRPDTISISGNSFQALWNGAGWDLGCAITADCGEPQTASWLYRLTQVP